MRPVGLSSLVALILAASAPLALADDKLDGNDKKWLAQVSALIQSDEQTIYKKIPKADRAEFQVIFWARRNPQGPVAPANEFKERFLRSAEEADKKFSVAGASGASTGCARVYLLLGPPDKVTPVTEPAEPGRGVDALGMLGRTPEHWTYKDRPGLTFAGGQFTIPFDGRCDYPAGTTLNRQLAQLASDRITTPDVKPEMGSDGRLVSLNDLLKRRRTPAQMLFVTPRRDFSFEYEPKLVMRTPLGKNVGTYAAGLLRVPVAGLTATEAGGKKKYTLLVATQLVGADGHVVRETDGQRAEAADADGRVVISYSTAAVPGSYTLRVAVADPAGDKGAVSEMPLSLPDYTSPGLQLADLQVLADIETAGQEDAQDPLADFVMAGVRLVPRFGNVFRKRESVQFLCLGYNAELDPTTHKASVAARFEVLKGGKVLTASNEMTSDTADLAPSLGPVPLSSVEPGTYQVRVVVSDRVAKKDLTVSRTYEVVP